MSESWFWIGAEVTCGVIFAVGVNVFLAIMVWILFDLARRSGAFLGTLVVDLLRLRCKRMRRT